MNNKYDIEMGIHSYPSIKVKGRYDDENILVDVPLETEGTNKSWKNMKRCYKIDILFWYITNGIYFWICYIELGRTKSNFTLFSRII